MRVALFITCLSDTFFPRAGVAIVAVLEHLGHTVHFPPDQTCCGQPMYNSGFRREAAALAERFVRAFEGADAVVTPSASCAAMARHHIPELLGDSSRGSRAALLGRSVREFSEFLTHELRVDLRRLGARWPGVVTYHMPCHLRELGDGDCTPGLLRQIDGLEFIAVDRSEQCCGFGGAFAVTHGSLSAAMARDKADSVRRTGAACLVCNEGGCGLNIAGAARRAGHAVPMLSVAEIVAESLGLLPRSTA